MKNLRKNKGITLIALIITIIVMLILVGVTVNVALSGGLFTTAKKATQETEKQVIFEQIIEIVKWDNTGNIKVGDTLAGIVTKFGADKVSPNSIGETEKEVIIEVTGKNGTYEYLITNKEISDVSNLPNRKVIGKYFFANRDDMYVDIKLDGTFRGFGGGTYKYEDTNILKATISGQEINFNFVEVKDENNNVVNKVLYTSSDNNRLACSTGGMTGLNLLEGTYMSEDGSIEMEFTTEIQDGVTFGKCTIGSSASQNYIYYDGRFFSAYNGNVSGDKSEITIVDYGETKETVVFTKQQ